MPNPPVVLMLAASVGLAFFIYYCIVRDREEPMGHSHSRGSATNIRVGSPTSKRREPTNGPRARKGPVSSDCSICQDAITGDVLNQVLSCGHNFHTRCILKWLQQASPAKCPNCRKEIHW